MNCHQARDAMLTAERSALLGGGAGELEAHLASCDACAALARSLANDLDALGDAVQKRSRRTARVIMTALPIAAMALAAVALTHRKAQPRLEAIGPGPSRGVSVRVGRGQQAAVFATKDTNVTVVWITTEGGL